MTIRNKENFMNTDSTIKETITVNEGSIYENTFECDILLVDLICKLNEKGYFTMYCCSGHEEDAFKTFYICFVGKVNPEENNNLITMINKIPELYYETIYDLYLSTNFNHTYIQIIDYDNEQIKMARKLASYNYKNFNDYIPYQETYSICVRTTSCQNSINQNGELILPDNITKELVEVEKLNIYNVICKWLELLDKE